MSRRPDLLAALDIVTEVVTMHWTPEGCRCWLCREARAANIGARPSYMPSRRTRPERGYVHVDIPRNTPRVIPTLYVNGDSDI